MLKYTRGLLSFRKIVLTPIINRLNVSLNVKERDRWRQKDRESK